MISGCCVVCDFIAIALHSSGNCGRGQTRFFFIFVFYVLPLRPTLKSYTELPYMISNAGCL